MKNTELAEEKSESEKFKRLKVGRSLLISSCILKSCEFFFLRSLKVINSTLRVIIKFIIRVECLYGLFQLNQTEPNSSFSFPIPCVHSQYSRLFQFNQRAKKKKKKIATKQTRNEAIHLKIGVLGVYVR